MILRRHRFSNTGLWAAVVWIAFASAALPEEPPLAVETIAATPAWWPKQVGLLRAVAVPVVVNGKVAGQAQLPAGTVLRLLRVVGGQVEVEHQGGRQLIPADATDLAPRATALKATGTAPASPVVAPPVSSTSARATPVPVADGADPALYSKRAREVMAGVQKTFYNPRTALTPSPPPTRSPTSCGAMA